MKYSTYSFTCGMITLTAAVMDFVLSERGHDRRGTAEVVVADQRGKWRKLRSAGQPGHGRVTLGHGMLKVDDVAVFFSGRAIFIFGQQLFFDKRCVTGIKHNVGNKI